jgi:hypothetical protein
VSFPDPFPAGDIMPKASFRLSTLFLFIIVAGVGFAAVGSSSEFWAGFIFHSAVAILAVASVKARYARGRAGAWWFGFAVFGWAHLLLGPEQGGDRALLTDWALMRLVEHLAVPAANDYEVLRGGRQVMIIHDLTSIAVAPIGGWLTLMLARRLGGQRHRREVR